MLKQTIEWTSLFDGSPQSDTFYFHLSEIELTELQAGNLAELLDRIIREQDTIRILEEFKNILLTAHGVRDGENFLKSVEIRDRFSQHPAFSAMFMRMLREPTFAADCIIAMLPDNLRDSARKGIQDAEVPVLDESDITQETDRVAVVKDIHRTSDPGPTEFPWGPVSNG